VISCELQLSPDSDTQLCNYPLGNVYYVGTEQLATFLITTPQGHILINSDFEVTVPAIRASDEKPWLRKMTPGYKPHPIDKIWTARGSRSVNPGYVLVNNKDYPSIADDYVRSFKLLRTLPVDVIDPAGFKAYVDSKEKAFNAELAAQKAKQ